MAVPRAWIALALCIPIASAATRPKASTKTSDKSVPASVRQWTRSMTLRDKVAQLIIMPIYGEPANTRSAEFRKYQHFIRDLRVGGVIVTGHSLNGGVRNAEPYAMAALLNRLQKMAKTPLFVSADFERGASMRVNSTTAWPYSMAFGAAQDLTALVKKAQTPRATRAPWASTGCSRRWPTSTTTPTIRSSISARSARTRPRCPTSCKPTSPARIRIARIRCW